MYIYVSICTYNIHYLHTCHIIYAHKHKKYPHTCLYVYII